MSHDEKKCAYHPERICVGFECQPHPCQYFLGMDKDAYEELKEYTVWASVYRKEEFQKTLDEMKGM